MSINKINNQRSQPNIKIFDSRSYRPTPAKPSPRYYEESPEARSQKRGWNEGLKHLVSKNFQDMEQMTKPAFGLPPINFKQRKDEGEPESEKGKKLWGCISKSLLDPLSDGETVPYVLKVHEERQKLQKRIFMQEFAIVNNVSVRINGEPSSEDYERAHKKLSNLKGDGSDGKMAFNRGSFGIIKTHNVEPIPESQNTKYSKEE